MNTQHLNLIGTISDNTLQETMLLAFLFALLDMSD